LFSLEVIWLVASLHDCVGKIDGATASFGPVLANHCCVCTRAQAGAFDQGNFIGTVGGKDVDGHDHGQIEFLAVFDVLLHVGQALGQQVKVLLQ